MPHRTGCTTNIVFSTAATEDGKTIQSQTIEHFLVGPCGFMVTVHDVAGNMLGERMISAEERPFLVEFFHWLRATRADAATISSS